MSRSSPGDLLPNPSIRWFEWEGEHGAVRYYDKALKERVTVKEIFSFLLLDQLSTVKGWHDESKSGIYANEVRDTRQDPFTVKAFKGGVLASGLYRDIKPHVNAEGGRYYATLYLAFKHDGGLQIGALQLKGAALRAWMEFAREHRAQLYEKAIRIKDAEEGIKGRVRFYVPVFELQNVSAQTHEAALALDATLQTYLTAYFERQVRQQVSQPPAPVEVWEGPVPDDAEDDAITASDVPF
jgi:hypothetical protein